MKILQSVYFNIVLAVVAAVLIIMQEFWLGIPLLFLNCFALGGIAGIGFSWIAEALKLIFFTDGSYRFNTKKFLIGCGCGIVAALITALCVI